ncbi:lysine-specific histone demethylase 1 homolog 3-like [Macadamia integrifolia]|uniref:lysine-specific histone demethylase 1 homolog 3-like n=1 Tax=Macadamia integrifolia TaxID=60698 RepID=UPI001C52F353|nr:lysine-specific histone demethylase 1 homolog 3-like [Macadamia integrifolia]XP_042480782.1 lysine-specific histone demethylase 1 homolog 3-like [Macadamia integrifolia]XP_042480783.1 lysine-specific histone demethylase 1 homolog 3-like [Macadamia integrifolia]
MNDEGYLSFREGISDEELGSKSSEGLHVASEFNNMLGLQGESLSSRARAGDAKMSEEGKNSSSKRRSKIVEVRVHSNDDDEPIGSLLTLKRGRNPKRAKPVLNSGDVEPVQVRAEYSMDGDEDLGEMDDTLASFRKKLKGPKMGKDGESGRVKGTDSALSAGVMKGRYSHKPLKDGAMEAKSHENPVEQSPAIGVDGLSPLLNGELESRPKGRGKSSRVASIPKKTEDFNGGLGQHHRLPRSRGTLIQGKKENEDSSHSSDENLEVSLSAFVRKSQPGSVRRARSSSVRKHREESAASGDALIRGSEVSEDVLSMITQRPRSNSSSKSARKIHKIEGRIDMVSGVSQIDPVVQKESLETQRSDADTIMPFKVMQGNSLACPSQELASAPEIDIVRFNDIEYNKTPDGIPKDQGCQSVAHIKEKASTGRGLECYRENLDNSNQLSCGVSGDFPCGNVQESYAASVQKLTEETWSLQGRLKQCSQGKSGASGHDVTEKSSIESDSKLMKKSGVLVADVSNVPEDLPSSIASSSAGVSLKFDGAFDGTSDVLKTAEESAGSDNEYDQSAVGVPKICHSSAIPEPCSLSLPTPVKEILVSCSTDDQLNRSLEETCKGISVDHSNCLNQPCGNNSNEPSNHVEKLSSAHCKTQNGETKRCDEPFWPLSEKKLEEILKPQDRLGQFPDGFSKGQLVQLHPSSSASGSTRKEGTYGHDDVPNQSLDTFADYHHDSSSTRTEETSVPDCGLFSVSLLSDIVRKSDFSLAVNQEEAPDNVNDPRLFSGGPMIGSDTCFQQHSQPSDDALKAINIPNYDPVYEKEEAKGTCSPSLPMHPEEICPEDAEVEPDPENEDKKLSMMQRALRKIKKRRHGDMAYEGDNDWKVLMHEHGFLENNYILDGDRPSRVKDKSFSPSFMVSEADKGLAAVAAGLKARIAGPVEKIKFREVLKRRGGLQEYLECRNLILGLWSKDTSRILPLVECGVTDVSSKDETPSASLIREIYSFLDQSGYINVGVASEKDKAEPHAKAHYRLSEEKIRNERVGAGVADSEDGVAFILGQLKCSENLREMKNNVLFDDAKLISEATEDGKQVLGPELSTLESDECLVDNGNADGCVDALSIDPSSDIVDGGSDSILAAEHVRDSSGVESAVIHPVEGNDSMQCESEARKRIIVVGAGPAGLTAARHLQRQGFSVTVIEARNRMGGRVYTDHSSLSVPVDLGASIITGVEADVATERRPDPSSLVCAQLGLELTVLNSDCPLYDFVTGQKVPADLDEALEAEFNSLLDDMLVLVAQKGELAMRMSLEDGLEYALKRRLMVRSVSDAEKFELHTSVNASSETGTYSLTNEDLDKTKSKDEILSPLERRVMDWHFANLEYGCAASLKAVSLPYWNQDDVYGGFGGAHCMIKGGYSTVVESLGKGLNVLLNHAVTEIFYGTGDSRENDENWSKVKVSTSNGGEFVGDAVLITVPLGCLKANTIKFSPALPDWKESSIQRLGFGVLNKVVLEFPEVFWDDTVDYFGATAEETDRRGQCFMFWNVKKTVGAPVLIALVVGKAALDGQNLSSSDHVNNAVMILRKLFGESSVPDPVATVVTNWGKDPFSRGAYSYVAVGSSGEDYDILGRPVENRLFFAGEATCKEHPDTVGGAMMSGLREAVRIIDMLSTGNDYAAEVEAMEAALRQSDGERNEVRDLLRRLDAVELSGVLYKSSLDGEQMLTKEALLKDMFFNAKTTAGRLHLAKELLNLPVEVQKSIAGTKEGLSTLNSWILDSMGKDGTQLLRHCVRLLVLVSTDLLAVRLSGIGRTVKEKVCVHTSRDIRAVASQLVSMWIEVFRKEKASNGGLKLLRQATTMDSSKAKSLKDFSSGKPPLRTTHGTPDNKGAIQVPSSGGSHSPSNVNSKNNKKPSCKPSKLETITDSKSEVSSRSEDAVQGLDFKVDDSGAAMSEEEAAAFAAAESARAAAMAAAKAYASSEAECSTLPELPKIPSFHKFARREQYAQMDDSDIRRKKWPGDVLGRQDCISEIDSRNCKVRNWSVDFFASCANLDSMKMSVDDYTQRSFSNEVAYQLNLREHSGESVAVDGRFSKAWVDSAGSGGVKDYHAIERWRSQAAAADSNFYHSTEHLRDEEDSNTGMKLHSGTHERRAEESSASQLSESKLLGENQRRGVERIKQAVVDYVASLLMPLYKARKIDKEGYKSMMKKSATKVMEQTTDAEKAMTVPEFLDFKRRNKIRSFVDKLIEKHMAMNSVAKS